MSNGKTADVLSLSFSRDCPSRGVLRGKGGGRKAGYRRIRETIPNAITRVSRAITSTKFVMAVKLLRHPCRALYFLSECTAA